MGNDASVIHSDWDVQRERLSAYLDSELAAPERTDVEAHLSDCDECQRELAALRQTRSLLRALPAPALPRAFTLPETPAPSHRRAAPVWARPAQALGGLAAIVGLGLLIGTTLPHPGAFRSTAGGSSAAAPMAPSGVSGAATTAPTPTVDLQSRPLTPTSTPVHAPATGVAPIPQTPAQPFPVAPVTGGTLLVGGAAALTAGSLARRRARRLPE